MNQNTTTASNDKSLMQMIIYGLLTKLVLVSVQFIYVEMFVATGAEDKVDFSNQYMRECNLNCVSLNYTPDWTYLYYLVITSAI